MLRLFGSLPSRAFRCLWMLEECGVPYEHVRVPFAELREPEFRRLNPNARVPVLVDGDFVLWESMAINLHLAAKHGGALWPGDDAARAHTLQWTFWAVAHVEPLMQTLMQNRVTAPPAERDEARAAEAERALAAPLAILDGALADRPFLAGERFQAADLNVASILSTAVLCKVELDRFPEARNWLHVCLRRPYPYRFFAQQVG